MKVSFISETLNLFLFVFRKLRLWSVRSKYLKDKLTFLKILCYKILTLSILPQYKQDLKYLKCVGSSILI